MESVHSKRPVDSYRTLAENDKFVVVGDTQSPSIRAYRKLSEDEVGKLLSDYAKANDIHTAPIDPDLQKLASTMFPPQKERHDLSLNSEKEKLASAYQKYNLPENSGVERVSIHKNPNGAYVISADLGVKGITPERKLERDDLHAYFTAKTATRGQLAAKYLNDDIKALMHQSNKVETKHGLKL